MLARYFTPTHVAQRAARSETPDNQNQRTWASRLGRASQPTQGLVRVHEIGGGGEGECEPVAVEVGGVIALRTVPT